MALSAAGHGFKSRQDFRQDTPFDFAPVSRRRSIAFLTSEDSDARSILGSISESFEHASVAEQLEPGAARVVHHEEGHPIGDVQVARANKLTVAVEIREADEIRSQHLYEPRRTSAVLHVRPPCLAYGRHVEAIARGDEAGFLWREWVSLGCILHDLVLPKVFVLGLLHGGREDELHIFFSHRVYFSRSHT